MTITRVWFDGVRMPGVHDVEFTFENPATRMALRIADELTLERYRLSEHKEVGRARWWWPKDAKVWRYMEASNDPHGGWWIAFDMFWVRATIFWQDDGSVAMASAAFYRWANGMFRTAEASMPYPPSSVHQSHALMRKVNDVADGFLVYAMRHHGTIGGCGIFLNWLEQEVDNEDVS